MHSYQDHIKYISLGQFGWGAKTFGRQNGSTIPENDQSGGPFGTQIFSHSHKTQQLSVTLQLTQNVTLEPCEAHL